MTEEKIKISVVITAKNEESCIAAALESVQWADEIIVVDDESTDKTVEICKKYTDKIYFRKMDVEGRHRNWAYAKAVNKWVLSLDADEKVTPELKEEMARAIKAAEFAAYSIPLRNYIGDYWVKHAGWYPAAKVRLFQKDKFKYEETPVHPRVFIDGKCGHLKGDIIHRGYPELEHFLGSINRQSTLEAVKWIDSKKKVGLIFVIWRTVDRFFRRFVGKEGWKDGFYGFIIAFFDSLYQVLSYLKYIDMKNRQRKIKAVFLDRDGVINEYPGDFKYVTAWENFRFLPNIKPALKKLNDASFAIFVISNQAGVSKGVYSQATLNQITENFLDELKRCGVAITGVHYCTHRQEANCACRKPKAGLVKKAIQQLKKQKRDINLAESYFIGDTERDVAAGHTSGLKTILVFSGKEKPGKKDWKIQPDLRAADLKEAVGLILQ